MSFGEQRTKNVLSPAARPPAHLPLAGEASPKGRMRAAPKPLTPQIVTARTAKTAQNRDLQHPLRPFTTDS